MDRHGHLTPRQRELRRREVQQVLGYCAARSSALNKAVSGRQKLTKKLVQRMTHFLRTLINSAERFTLRISSAERCQRYIGGELQQYLDESSGSSKHQVHKVKEDLDEISDPYFVGLRSEFDSLAPPAVTSKQRKAAAKEAKRRGHKKNR